MIRIARGQWKYLLWAVCATIWATLCFIAPDFSDNPIHDFHAALTILAYIAALGVASFWIIYLLGLNKYIAWISLPIFSLGGAAVSYFRVAFHATITPMIVDATLHTNSGTIAGVISWQLIVWIVLNLLIAGGFIWWRNRIEKQPKAWLQALVMVLLLLVYYNANGRLKFSINQRYPYNIVHGVVEYSQQQQQLSTERSVLAYEAKAIPDSIDVVFVLGEAVRADHLQLNGYERETNPILTTRTNVVSLPHVYSEYTYTSSSVPVILSPADNLHPERSGTHSSFIRVLNENGFHSAWLSNQDNGRSYISFIHEADTVLFPNASKSVFVFDPWYDEQLLGPLDALLQHESARNIYVFHTIGSHWYYDLHVPSALHFFTPTTTNRIVTYNTQEQVINSYDNTVRYMDLFVDSLIQRIESRCAILIFLSDHGEALGEDGQYLHASDNEALHLPACIVWYSNAFATAYPEKIKALLANKDKRYRTDFLYYSILSATGIESEGDNPSVDIFMP